MKKIFPYVFFWTLLFYQSHLEVQSAQHSLKFSGWFCCAARIGDHWPQWCWESPQDSWVLPQPWVPAHRRRNDQFDRTPACWSTLWQTIMHYHFLFEINRIWPFFERRGTDFIEMNDVNALVVSTRRKIQTGYLFISSDQLYYTYIQSIILDSEILRLCHFRTSWSFLFDIVTHMRYPRCEKRKLFQMVVLLHF